MPVSVNLPTHLLDQPDLPDQLYNRSRSAVFLSKMSLSNCWKTPDTNARALLYGRKPVALKGFGLAQDDFGKGYNSMYTLISTSFNS